MDRVRRQFVAAAEMAVALRLRHDRAALRARLSAVVLHHAAHQPAHRRIRRLAREPHALSARDLRRGARGRGRPESRSRFASPPPTGSATTASTPHDAVEIARLLQEAGVDICDVSAGQTSVRARPVYGRMFQTPFSDRIRNETGIATMAVGNIYEPDHVNSILMAGRADLVCLARPHLADPYWTLHAAATLGDTRASLARALPARPRPALSPRRRPGGDGAIGAVWAPRRQACAGHRRRHRHRRGHRPALAQAGVVGHDLRPAPASRCDGAAA